MITIGKTEWVVAPCYTDNKKYLLCIDPRCCSVQTNINGNFYYGKLRFVEGSWVIENMLKEEVLLKDGMLQKVASIELLEGFFEYV